MLAINTKDAKLVGEIGFEPTTLWSQTRCSARLSYTPNFGGGTGSRTPNSTLQGLCDPNFTIPPKSILGFHQHLTLGLNSVCD